MSPWSAWTAAACLPSHCNCEAVRSAWVAQPSAFWSSGAYLIAWISLWIKRRQFTDGFKVWMVTFLILGLASHFAHGSMTEVAMACDFGAICLLLVTPACTRFRFSSGIPLFFIPLSFAFFGAAKTTKIGIALFVFAVTLLEHGRTLRARLKEPGFKKAVGLVSASFLLFIWDEMQFHCEPESWLQGHSLWHLGSAWAIVEYGKWRFRTPSPADS